MQSAVAEEFGEKLRGYQEVMFPAAYGDGTREWTHLVLTKVGLTPQYPWALHGLKPDQHTHEQAGILAYSCTCRVYIHTSDPTLNLPWGLRAGDVCEVG